MGFEWLSALANGGDVISKTFNTAFGLYQDWRNYTASRSDTTWSKNLALWNALQQQREFDYAKDIQNQIFEREDNAVQRRVADLEKAGLSKTLAAGSGAGAGSVVSTHLANVGNPTSHVGGQSVSFQTNFLDMLKSVEEIKGIKEQINVAKEQKNRIKAETDSINLENEIKAFDFGKIKNSYGLNKSHGKLDLYYLLNNFLNDNVNGVTVGSSSSAPTVQEIIGGVYGVNPKSSQNGSSVLQSIRDHFGKAYIKDGELIIEEPKKKWFRNKK